LIGILSTTSRTDRWCPIVTRDSRRTGRRTTERWRRRAGRRAGGLNPLQYLDDTFSAYIAERRREPRTDVLTTMATTTYPDGSTPDLLDVVRPATFLFAAGQETVTKLLSSAVQVLGERPDLQEALRENRKLVGPFIEEALRMQSPTKVDFRLDPRHSAVCTFRRGRW
jgi:cytochrome P450